MKNRYLILFTLLVWNNVLSAQNILNWARISTNQGFISPPQEITGFGSGMCNIGDINKDGIQDMAVQSTDLMTLEGAIYILFLSQNFTVKSYAKISKNIGGLNGVTSSMQAFGKVSLANIGDLDGDGTNELLVGNSLADNGKGMVFVLFLDVLGSVKKYKTIGSESLNLSNNDNFGTSVSVLSDLNLDGIKEIAIGAPYDNEGGTQKGAAYIIFLDSSANIKKYQKISTVSGNFKGSIPTGSGDFGRSVCGLNISGNDTLANLVVSSSGSFSRVLWSLFLNDQGKVVKYVKIDQDSGNFKNYATSIHPFENITNAGDMNGDLIDDLAIGNYLDSVNNKQTGDVKIILFNKKSEVIGVNSLFASSIHSELQSDDFFGFSVSGIYDFNGDFKNDIIVGSPRRDDGGIEKGAIYLLSLDGAVHPTPPKALWQVNATSGNQNTVFNFTQYSTGFPSAYKWSISPNTFTYQGGTSDTSANPIIKFNETANYSVQLKVTNPFSSDSLLRSSYISVQKVGVNNVGKSSTSISIYPNPTNGLVQIQSPIKIQSILVFDITGKQLLQQQPDTQTDEINISNLPPGLYQIHVQTEMGVMVKKLVKL